ncbi:fumarylacetoacetate hydrolase family protein [Hoeflea alexandrii]|uniref:fumarylacetoacetate hydrolase family protein n=1 Tax=Hoeflea alexandrii TaxID=288436 RepID=UPI0022AFDD11|nr:fumarylacetoacetate hydrolase family protein [Hoeflea alexandrii]MCZ4291605.1 fumarylacetoacetate hydrolase family protein [Hoeflea alexandrii]
MKLARFDKDRIGVVVDSNIFDVTDAAGVDPMEWPPVGATRLIADFEKMRPALERAAAEAAPIPLSQVILRTPVPWPNKVVAFPVNYHAHGAEMGAGYRATNQGFFLKPNSSLSGAGEPVVLPETPGREVHHESELAIVIGKTCRNVAAEDWQDYVFGYSCLLDMVVRGREERVARKAYDTFCPVGPWITTADEVPDPSNLRMQLWVDGELRQDANTRDLVLNIPGMIAMASAVMTLYPGDIIATGTPEGVGPVKPGQTIRITIDHCGEMNVPVIQGQGGSTEIFKDPYQLVKKT